MKATGPEVVEKTLAAIGHVPEKWTRDLTRQEARSVFRRFESLDKDAGKANRAYMVTEFRGWSMFEDSAHDT